jgi:prevent-host-death family protein
MAIPGELDRSLPVNVQLKERLEVHHVARVPKIIPITDLRQDAAAVLKLVRAQREPLIITQRGRAAAVMLSVEAYERSEEERRILLLLARGDREIAEGKGHELADVLKEADALLSAEEP